MKIADQIKLLRRDRGWSQGELAKRSGIMQSMLSRLENTSNEMITIKTLMKLARAMGAELKIELVPKDTECASPISLVSCPKEKQCRGSTGIEPRERATTPLRRTRNERYWESHGILL